MFSSYTFLFICQVKKYAVFKEIMLSSEGEL